MAYATSNPPKLIGGALASKGGGKVFLYRSADDDATTNGASYYSNGVLLGMEVGDIVLVIDTTTPKVSLHGVASVSGDAATTAFGAVA